MANVIKHISPNQGPRRNGLRPSLVVIHYTAMQTAADALERLCDPAVEVSAHYLISTTGDVIQMVEEDQRAWHAGQGEWAGQDDINSRSIGIELDNTGDHPFSEPQMSALEALLGGILGRWDIQPDGVIGHSDMAPGRKSDPGPHFDWARLARQGLAGQGRPNRPAAAPSPETFTAHAKQAGFTADAALETLLATTRLRFAPWRTGPLCAEDMNLCHMPASKWK
ncbi:N-acetylmuramoyl-L-alanine amidase [Sulfitobacter marinus]|uniref:N-acetylmuramoyl-L-alanine amidase n=1 Tax=Sulfitobacter marinus TaxID=394264 RepID=A0A1I6PE37_9RHOB|nr:N-acetylmuramoyl-L-alanine amidase [Sulfitobacter marinus]SFS38446.1 N-acetylmuramoyl-L-alanine amidase [Sulfitobacter marinus]